jgi:peptidoglycan/LPS O-acetylase OafA/YrhL
VIFFLPRRFLPAVLVGMILLSPLFRVWWTLAGLGEAGSHVLTPAAIDALALGALAAFLPDRQRLIAFIGLTGFALWLVSYSLAKQYQPGDMSGVLFAHISTTAAAMFFMWVVARAARGFGGVVGALLNNAALRYIGAISYGIYLLHLFMPFWLSKAGVHLPLWQFYWVASATTISLAALSWHFLERPIMRLGRTTAMPLPASV